MSTRIGLCLIDQDPAAVASFQRLMKSSGIRFVSFSGVQQYLAGFRPKNIGCIVLSVPMHLQEILKQQQVYIPVIVLVSHADVPMAVQAMKNGAFDVVESPFDKELLLDRIHKAFDLYSDWQSVEIERKDIAARIAELTAREAEVMDLMVSGHKSRMIAERLGISTKTFDAHRGNIMRKMKARTVIDLVRWKLLNGSGPGGVVQLPTSDYRP